jgi:hypothetical protein
MSKRIKVDMNPAGARLQGEMGLTYAAGLLDGEGCIHIARQRKAQARRGYVLRLVVTVAQNHLRTLTDFQDMAAVEGRIYMLRRQGPANRDSYTLNYDGSQAGTLLERLQPYLGRKLDEARVALRFQNETQIHRHFGPGGCPDEIWQLRELLCTKLRSLK